MGAKAPARGFPIDYSDLFDQDEVWVDGHGVTHRIAEMEPSHALNVLRYVRRHADNYHFAIGMSLASIPVVGTQAGYDLDDAISEFGRTEPVEWLRGTALYRALCIRVAESML